MPEPSDNLLEFGGNGTKAVLSGAVSIFLLGAVFWAGATYNRVQAIETHLISIDTAISKIGNIQAIDERTQNIERRLDRMEDTQNKMHIELGAK